MAKSIYRAVVVTALLGLFVLLGRFAEAQPAGWLEAQCERALTDQVNIASYERPTHKGWPWIAQFKAPERPQPQQHSFTVTHVVFSGVAVPVLIGGRDTSSGASLFFTNDFSFHVPVGFWAKLSGSGKVWIVHGLAFTSGGDEYTGMYLWCDEL